MPSAESPDRSSGDEAQRSQPSSAATVRLEAFHIDALLGGAPPEKVAQCTGWEADYCFADIESADLVSLRFDPVSDVSKGPETSDRPSTADAYYQSCASSLDRSLPLRLGLCCCRWQQDDAVWELRSHELALFPGDLLALPEDIRSSRFRIAAARATPPGGESSTKGVDAKLGPPGRWSEQLASCSKMVVNALCAVQVPIVVHNGLPDLLHICDKFGERVPENSLALGRMLSKHFPVVFDTGLLVQDRVQDPAEHGQLFSLQEMHATLAGAPHKVNVNLKEFGMYTHRASSSRKGLVFGRGIGAGARDAMSIAEAFLMEMGHRVSLPSAQPKQGLQPLLTDASDKQENDDGASPQKEIQHAASPQTNGKRPAGEIVDSPPRKCSKCSDASPQQSSEGNGSSDARSATPQPSVKPRSAGQPAPSTPQKHSSPTSVRAAQGHLLPGLLRSHVSCLRFHNRVAAEGTPCLQLRQSPLMLPKAAGFDLHSLLRQLGAKEDSEGRPVVTRAMTKQLRRVLGEMKSQSQVSSHEGSLGA